MLPPTAAFASSSAFSLGVVWTLYLTETPLGRMARIGIVILVAS